MLAAKYGHEEMVRALIAEGADLDFSSENDASEIAKKFGFHNIANFIKWAKIEKNYEKAFSEAFLADDQMLAKEIYRRGHLVNKVQDNENGMTLFMYAASVGHLPLVKLLVECGEDINQQSKRNFTAIDYAIEENHQDVVTFLKSKGANSKISAAQKKLYAYIAEVDKRDDNHYLKSISCCFFKINFGCSAGKKKAAAKALLKVIKGTANPSTLFAHKEALENGRLKAIYRALI